MKKLYAVEVKFADGTTISLFETGEDELEAIDRVHKYITNEGKEILDIKVMKG